MFSDPQKNIEQWGLLSGALVADFGSGSGHHARAIAKAVGDKGRVFAVDIQKDLLTKLKNDLAKDGLLNVEVIWGDVEKKGGTRLKDSSLDAVLVSNLLFQVLDKETVLQEVKRVLKPQGSLLVIDWADSFGGLGPRNDSVFGKEKAIELCTRNGFHVMSDIDAGAHHYGVIFQKM